MRLSATRHAGLALAAAAALLAGCKDPAPEASAARVTFSILAAQGQASAEPLWRPLLDDLSAALGAPVEPRFTASYSAPVEALRSGSIEAAWLSAQPAVEALDGSGAELLARTVSAEGEDSYRAVLIVRKGSGLTLDDVLDCERKPRIGLGDAHSTTGALAPQVFLFAPKAIDPDTCFDARAANHERNALEVASGILDAAITNTVTLQALQRQNPVLAAEIETVWRSPPIPEGAVVAGAGVDPALKEKMRSFLLSYGRGESVAAERQRRVLTALGYSRFAAADDDYLDPVREMMADQALREATARGDRAGVAAARETLTRLRAKREVQP